MHNNYNASKEVAKKQKENAHKGEASETVKHPIPQQARQHEVEKIDAIVQHSRCIKIIVDEDLLIIDIIRSREMATTMNVEDAIKFVEEASSTVETLHVRVVQVEHTLALAEIHNGNQQSNSFADMRIIGPWRDAVTDMDYGNDHTLSDFDQELGTNNSVVGTDPNLSNFSANVIHDMQVLGLVPTVALQTMDFLSDPWANMGQKNETVDLARDTGHHFNLWSQERRRARSSSLKRLKVSRWVPQAVHLASSFAGLFSLVFALGFCFSC